MHLLSLSTAVVALASLASGAENQLKDETAFTDGPTSASMHIYVPTVRLPRAPIVVALHQCTGTGPAYFNNSQYANYADKNGFLVIYPTAPSSCWDVSSTATLTHDQGGDSKTIVNMVSYAVKNYGGDPDRVFVTGSSSGAMMTNVLAGAYPDVFKAGSAYSGVPDGCFFIAGEQPGQDPTGWNVDCSEGKSVKTGQEWANLSSSYFPDYRGSYPKLLIWHGTSDTSLNYANLAETLKQWSTVLDVPFTKNVTDNPESGYTEMVYGDGTKLVGYSGQGVGHPVPLHESVDLSWFGLVTVA